MEKVLSKALAGEKKEKNNYNDTLLETMMLLQNGH